MSVTVDNHDIQRLQSISDLIGTKKCFHMQRQSQLTALPDTIRSWTSLQKADFSGNQLKVIPEALLDLPLRLLDLRQNPIQSFSARFIQEVKKENYQVVTEAPIEVGPFEKPYIVLDAATYERLFQTEELAQIKKVKTEL